MREHDIRPKKLFQRYLELSLEDARGFSRQGRAEVSCPGCGHDQAEPRFEKNGFAFVRCKDCGSLYCSPRPHPEELEAFYRDGESSRYWAEVFFPAVAEMRRERLFKPRAKAIADLLTKQGFTPKDICDVGAGYGILLEELAPHFPAARLCAVEPGQALAETCRAKGLDTIESTAECAGEYGQRFDLVVCSEVIEHVYSTLDFLSALRGLVREGGKCLVTGLGYEGFDILTLQADSDSVFPPHHLNFPSLAGFKSLFSRARFTSCQVTTPGKLDADIVRNADADNEFLRVLYDRGEEAVADFQALLSKHCLSSHVWILASA